MRYDEQYKSKQLMARLREQVPELSLIASPGDLDQGTLAELVANSKNGNQAATTLLIESHVQLIKRMARKYSRYDRDAAKDFEQEGSMAILKAIKRFDASLGESFSAFAHKYIRLAMIDYKREKMSVVHLPGQVLNFLTKMNKADQDLQFELKRKPTYKELSARIGINQSHVERFEQAALMKNVLSLDGGEQDFEFEDFLIGESDLPEAKSEEYAQASSTKSLLSAVLSEREKTIIELRFGLIEDRLYTFEEIGKLLSLSKQRVQQIESRALHKLRSCFSNQSSCSE